ncbi:MAG: nickel-dependent lactate racemase [Candidatus Hydrogenedens sp.]|nr:nickel-dependent lactate racemase [Candidatus Hydrogenedens sp.]
MRIELDYGKDTLAAGLDFGRCLGTIDIGAAEPIADVNAAFTEAMRHPIGLDGSAWETVQPGETVVIVVSDSFRTTRIEQILPALVAGLLERGVRKEDISFLFSTGTHRGPTEDEARGILGAEVYAEYGTRAYSHDPFDDSQLVSLGTTPSGTPVRVNRRAVECDRLILTGTAVLHYFGGFGGGRKSLVPGIAGVETIAANHARNLHPTLNQLNPAVRIGTLAGNPVAEDMLAAAKFCPVAFIVNTVLDRQGAIAGLFAGEMESAHQAACDLAARLFCVPIAEQADLVIATAGKAKNFIQSHKALFNAYQAMKPGGRMIFAARAEEGYGGNKFKQWLSLGTQDAVIAELRKNAEINGQTALSTLEKSPSAIMVTDLSADEVALLGACKADSLEAALAQAREEFAAAGNHEPTIWLMPSAPYTVPMPA